MNLKKITLTSVFVIILMTIATITSSFYNIYLWTIWSICFFTALNLGSILIYTSLNFTKKYKNYLFSYLIILLNVIIWFIFWTILGWLIFFK